MDEAALIEYYVDRLIYQYRAKPKARATIAILVKQLLAGGLLRTIEDAFWLDSAVGAQLDILAKYIGLPRAIGSSGDKEYFGCHDYVIGQPDNDNGFKAYLDATVNTAGEWYSYTSSALLKTEVDDTVFSPMLRLKALLNTWDGTLAGAEYIIMTFLAYSDAWYGAGEVTNRIYNPDMLLGTDGWGTSTWENTTVLPVAVVVAPSPFSLINGGTLQVQVTGTPTSGQTFAIDDFERRFTVITGDVWRFSATLQQVGCSSVHVTIRFRNVEGDVMADVGGTSAVLLDAPNGETLGQYAALEGTITVPTNAASAWLSVRGTSKGTASPWVGVTKASAFVSPAISGESTWAIVDTTTPTANRVPSTGTTGWANTYNGTGGTVALTQETSPAGLHTWGTLRSSVTGTPDAGDQWTTTTLPVWMNVVEGQVLDASAYVQGSGLAQAFLEVVYNTSGGVYVSQDKLMGVASPTNATTGALLSDYRRLTGFSTVPAGAQKAFLQVLAVSEGTSDPWVGIAKPVMQLLGSSGLNSAWSPGVETVASSDTWYIVEANLGIDPTTLVPYLPRKVGTSVKLTYSKLGTEASEHTFP